MVFARLPAVLSFHVDLALSADVVAKSSQTTLAALKPVEPARRSMQHPAMMSLHPASLRAFAARRLRVACTLHEAEGAARLSLVGLPVWCGGRAARVL
jgi:hypothetical protein